MSGWGELVDRITERLRVDPELRLDVAQELRAHLEDSAAEFRQAGQSEEEAAASAARALGDADQLAEQLWQANRRRIRVRGVCRWAAQTALLPAAVLVFVMLVLGVRGLYPVDWDSGQPVSLPAGMTEQQRFILLGDPAARTPLERAKSIADRWPDDPVYYGNYVVALMNQGGFYHDGRVRRERMGELLAALDKGERIDPDNAFYNFTKAAWLVKTSSTLSEDPSRVYESIDRKGNAEQKPCWKIDIRGRDRFERGLAELRRGLSKPQWTSRLDEMLQARLDLLGQPSRLNDCVRRFGLLVGAILPPTEETRLLSRSISAYAIHLAEQDRPAEAAEMVEAASRMALKLGGTGQTLISILVAEACRIEALAHAEQVHSQLGRPEEAKQARDAFEQEVAFYNRLRGGPRIDPRDVAHAGLFWETLVPGLPGYQMDFEPMRSAEQFVAAELALFVLLGCLVVVALVHGLLALLSLIRRRGEDRPVLLFVGWRRIGRTCLLAVALPLACYLFYAHVLTAADRAYGLNYTLGKTLLEYALLIAAVLLLLERLSYSAIRQRAEEIGMAVPPPQRLRDWPVTAGLGALIALAGVVYLVGWRLGPFKPPSRSAASVRSAPGLALAALVVLFLAFYELRERLGPLYPRPFVAFRRTLHRSTMPIFAAAAILIGLSCGWVLARGERSAVRRIRGAATMSLTNEIERSDYRLLRDRLARQYEAMTQPAR